ncbi:hypothetical protein NM208_g494 [Fusarium decemcellulare]|uniref:Uncharacterized protein n=1 Tax=Fusarium decemcellulare TaxID=57161 RepID=A0ACC1SZL1_9HYPO|nr:hypothetical protein NM208_g494 [Fusarium decemcellulare]
MKQKLTSRQCRDEPIWPNQAGHLKYISDAETRYYSSASWFFALEDKEPGVTIGGRSKPPQQHTGSTKHTTDSARHAMHNSDGFRQIDSLVSPAAVDRLVHWYADHCHFWYPIVDIAATTAYLESHRSGGVSSAPVGTSALLSSICYTASCSLAVSGDMSTVATCTKWRDLAQNLLDQTGYPSRPNLQTLRAALLLSLPSIAEFPSQLNLAPVSILIRTAQFLGLHRDPLMLHTTADEADAQRILWRSIQALDLSQSLAHALPPLTHHMHSDVELVSRPDNPDWRLLYTVMMVNKPLCKVLEGIYGIQQPTQATLQHLDAEAEKVCEIEASSHTELPQDAHARFIAISQACCCWKLKFILHQPYLRSPQWPRSSRSKALDASIKYIRDFSVGMTEPALAPYRWVLNHFNIFHACGIILQDLISFPGSPEALELRSVAEASFETFYIESDPTWERLEALRSKALSVNGWDELGLEMADMDVGLSDWDPLFALLKWPGPFLLGQ